jgi:enoyl-CoA hydratase/carnithine racemase
VDFETLRVRQEGAILFADIAAPPMNLLGTELVRDLVSLIQQAEVDTTLEVIVFASADPDYFISHVDVTRIGEYREQAARLAGGASLGLLFRYLSTSRPVTIAQIEDACVAQAASSCWRATCALLHGSQRSSVSRSRRSA